VADYHSSVTQANKTSTNSIAAEIAVTKHSHSPVPSAHGLSTNHKTVGGIPISQSNSVLPDAAKHSQYVCHMLLYCCLFCVFW